MPLLMHALTLLLLELLLLLPLLFPLHGMMTRVLMTALPGLLERLQGTGKGIVTVITSPDATPGG